MMLLSALLIASAPIAAVAQDEDDRFPIYVPPPPPPPPPLTPEHLDLATRLAGLIVVSEIGQDVERSPPPPEKPFDPAAPAPMIVARPPPQMSLILTAGAVYARLYSMDELRSMIAFFESRAGQKFLAARREGVVRVMDVIKPADWYSELFYTVCGDREFCRWKPTQ